MRGMTERHFQAEPPLHIKRTVISRRHSSRLACSTPSRTSSGPPHLSCPSRAAGGRRMMHPTSKGSSPQSSKGGSPNHDSLRSPFARKFLWTQESPPDSPLAHAPLHRRVCAECTSRAHSHGKVHQDTSEHASSTLQRSQSEPLKPLLHWAKRPVTNRLPRGRRGTAAPPKSKPSRTRSSALIGFRERSRFSILDERAPRPPPGSLGGQP